MIQATLVETVGYGGSVRDRFCARLAEGSLKAKEMLRGVVAYDKLIDTFLRQFDNKLVLRRHHREDSCRSP